MQANAIIGTPNILFLGAGASKPYGKLLMGEFIESFRENLKIQRKSSSLLGAICDKKADLEFLIEELEALSSRKYLENQSVDLNPPGSGRGGSPRWPDFIKLAMEARGLLALLKEELYHAYRNIRDVSRTSILAEPISLLRTPPRPAVVFTTNYDPAVEEFCASRGVKITDGFVRDPRARKDVWDRKNFDQFILPEAGSADALEESLVLFKLHGSADWFLKDGRIVKSEPMYVPNDPVYHSVMIYPATRKVAIEEPYFTAYDYLEQCLDNAESCLAIGYSFRDYDTVMRFKSAQLRNTRLKIVVLDLNANTVCEFLKGHRITAEAIPHAFGSEQRSMYLPLISEYM